MAKPEHNNSLDKFEDAHIVQDTGWGTAIEDITQPLILYKDRKSSLKELNTRFLVILPLLVMNFCIIGSIDANRWWQGIVLALFLIAMYVAQRRSCLMTVAPVAELTRDTLKLHCNTANIDIPWTEIKEIRAHHFFIPHIGIVPYDIARTARRGTLTTQFRIWFNMLCMGFYSPFKIFVAPIELFGTEFPLSAEDLVEHMERRRAHAQSLVTGSPSIAELPTKVDEKQ
jgi:hypothetical protein